MDRSRCDHTFEGKGVADNLIVSIVQGLVYMNGANLITVLVYLPSKGMSFPKASWEGPISNVARVVAMVNQT